MKLYGYQNQSGKIKTGEVEVEEKVILVSKDGKDFPLIYGNKIDKDDVGRVTGIYCPTVFLTSPDFECAKEKLLENSRKTLSEKRKAKESASKDVEDFEKQIESLQNEIEGADKGNVTEV